MPRTITEPRCNLTLSRADWGIVIGALERNKTPLAMEAVKGIRSELRKNPSENVGIDRDCQKWIGVSQMAWKWLPKRIEDAMREQVQAAERTQPW